VHCIYAYSGLSGNGQGKANDGEKGNLGIWQQPFAQSHSNSEEILTMIGTHRFGCLMGVKQPKHGTAPESNECFCSFIWW
jgi:hypothetical protein